MDVFKQLKSFPVGKYFTVCFLVAGCIVLTQSSCTMHENKCGCTDPEAINFDADADYDCGTCKYSALNFVTYDNPDNEGNLIINNNTDNGLRLYGDNYELIKTIEPNATKYIVNIPNENLLALELKIWKVDDVVEVNSPPENKVFKKWKVALSNNTIETERATWNVNPGNEGILSGLGLISYNKIDEYGLEVIYSVDIYVDSKTGAKIASLPPGVTNKKLNIEYGLRKLFYHFWFSDQQSGDISYVDAWMESKEIAINAQSSTVHVNVPLLYDDDGQYGFFAVENIEDDVISVFHNNNLIESIVRPDIVSSGLSYVNPSFTNAFLIPVNEDLYTFQIRNSIGTAVLAEFKNIYITPLDTFTYRFDEEKRTINVTNNTNEELFLYDAASNEYLGMKISHSTTFDNFTIPTASDNLLFSNRHMENTKFYATGYQSHITITTLDSIN